MHPALVLYRACLRQQPGHGRQVAAPASPARDLAVTRSARDGQLRITKRDRDVLGRVVYAIDLIGNVRRVGEGLKPMCAAGRCRPAGSA